MKRQRHESGQALVGTLVVMALVFAMAGAIALAASSLLDRQNAHRSAIADDLRASDALTAAVAHVAGRGLQAQPACSPAETINTVLPGGFASSANCLRFDEVATPVVLNSVGLTWNSGCASVPVPSRTRTWVFFSALASAGLSAWVDGLAGCNPGTPVKECSFTVTAAVGQAAMDCDLAELQTPPYLHVVNPLTSPASARFVGNGNGGNSADGDGGPYGSPGQPDTNGSIYDLAATTGLGVGLQYEEGAVFVSGDGTTTALIAEGAL